MKKFFSNLLCILTFILIIAFIIILYNFITKNIINNYDDLNEYIKTENLVEIDWPIDYDSSSNIKYYVVKGNDIDKAKKIINDGVLYDTYGERWIKKLDRYKEAKTAYFIYSDGSKKEIVFYGDGSRYFKIKDKKYGYASYGGETLGAYIYSLHGTKYMKDDNGNFIDSYRAFQFEDLFGEDYDKPWCGY